MSCVRGLRFALSALLLFLLPASIVAQGASLPPDSPWLFVGFKKDSKDGVYYAVSLDGYHWKLANGSRPVEPPREPGELMRDPFIQRAPDGSFRMVWTWSWNQPHVIGYSESRDLVTWSAHRQLPVMENEPGAMNVWAPALYYETAKKQWLIFWASTIPGRFTGDDAGDNKMNHRIFFATTPDFKSFSPAKVFFDPGFSVIDATVLPPASPRGTFTMIFKDERKNPLKKFLLTATGPSYEGPWSNVSEPISEPWSEGAAIIPVAAVGDNPAGYLAYYDHYSQGQHYGAIFSPDLVHWKDALSHVEFPAGMRHGSFMRISRAEYDRLAALNSAEAPAGN